MTLKMEVEISGFDVQVDDRSIVDRAGPELADRIRARAQAETGWDLAASIGYADGEIAPQGTRPDSDTHKNRPPLPNRVLAAMHANQGRPLFEVSDADERALAELAEPEIKKAFEGGSE